MMIHLPALPTASGPVNLAEILGNGSALVGEAGGFEIVLAVQTGPGATMKTPAKAGTITCTLPDPGKFLPPSSPLAEQSLPAQVETADPSDRLHEIATVLSPALPAAEHFIKPKAEIPGPVRAAAVPAKADIEPAASKDEEPKPPAMSDANASMQTASPPLALSTALPVLPIQPGLMVLEYADPIVRHASPQPEALSPAVTEPLIASALTEAVALAPPAPAPLALSVKPPASLAPTEPVILPLEHFLPDSQPMPLRSDLPPVQQEILTRVPIGPAIGSPLDKQPLPIVPEAAVPPVTISAEPVQPIAPPPWRSATSLRVHAASTPDDIQISPGIHPALPGVKLAAEASVNLHDVPYLQQPSTMAELRLMGPTSTLPALAAVRPLDFSALVDRLVQARDAAAPQTVSLALTHAEFGKVSLRFEQDDAGLSVAITSTDPDFARAASVAIPLERALPAEQQSQSSRHQSGSSDTAGQSRSGANPERRDERGTPRTNPGQTQRHHAERTDRSDIFA